MLGLFPNPANGTKPGALANWQMVRVRARPTVSGWGYRFCRSIIDAHRGRLWAEANEPRRAIFRFTLPAVQVGP